MKFTKQVISFLALLLLVAYLLINIFMLYVLVPTGSMLNTIPLNQILLVSKDKYVKSYQRGDIVVFYEDDELMIKRLIGLPGETVRIEKGTVFVDGQILFEEYLNSNTLACDGTFKIPDGCYFFLGDNRSISYDGRLWENAYVEKSSIVGKAIYFLFPKFGPITLPNYSGGDLSESD